MNALFFDPGRFRAQLALERCEPVPDGMGGHVENWSEVAILWGCIEPVRAGSYTFATREWPQISHRIYLRFNALPQSGMRLRQNGRLFHIDTVHDPDESRRYLLCLVREEGR